MTRAALLALGARVAALRDERAMLVRLVAAADQRLDDAKLELEQAQRAEQEAATRPVEIDVRAVGR